MSWVYVLDCADDVFYVGFATKLHDRLRKHFSGSGAKVTRKHKPRSVLFYKPGDKAEEQRVVTFFRKVYGPDRVFGGSFGMNNCDFRPSYNLTNDPELLKLYPELTKGTQPKT